MSQSLPCKPCADRGHTCWVDRLVDDVPMCVFCEDGEPCLEEIRKAGQAKPRVTPEAKPEPLRVHEVSKKATPSKGAAMRQVAMCGCGRLANHKGRCVARRNAGKEETAKEEPAKSATIKFGPELLSGSHPVPKTPAGDGAAHSGARASLQVNEEQLNRFIVGLPLADKARIANAWLMGDL